MASGTATAMLAKSGRLKIASAEAADDEHDGEHLLVEAHEKYDD